MGEFYLSEIKHSISDTNVLEVILGTSTNIFASFHIIAQSLANDEGILLVFQIPANGFSTDFHSSNRFERIRNSLHIRTGTNRRSQKAHQLAHSIRILQAITLQNILQINRLINLSKIVLFRFRSFHLRHSRQSTIKIIGFQGLTLLSSYHFIIFRKTQRMDSDFPTSTTKFSYHILR